MTPTIILLAATSTFQIQSYGTDDTYITGRVVDQGEGRARIEYISPTRGYQEQEIRIQSDEPLNPNMLLPQPENYNAR